MMMDLLAQHGMGNWIWLAAVVLAVMLVLISTRRRLARSRSFDARSRQQRTTEMTAHNDIRNQISELMVELQELARQTNAEIETRYTKLEVLLEEAKAAIDRLESLLELASQFTAEGSQGQRTNIREDPRFAEIFELSRQGRSPLEIAQQLNRNVGEIELILALGKR